MTTAEMEKEIAELQADPDVKLAAKERSLRYRRQRYLYNLRVDKKHGAALREAGMTVELLEHMYLEQIEREKSREEGIE